MYRNYRGGGSADRFDNYREIEARFDSTGTCGHEISKGDVIGWHPKLRKTQCTTCWGKWVAENQEADAIESGYMPCPW
ncbi:MAG: hypothetical protein JSU86_08505 [Phycisphaerales bacterium]|nr:MAG: hypothetical protein JSU86_08505 [Phycisphaerales bacterium]